MKKIVFRKLLSAMILVLLSVNSANVFATADNVIVSIEQNTTINIDLSGSIDPIPPADSADVGSPPANGTAVAQATPFVISYTPNKGFQGVDTFTYDVFDVSGGFLESATITVNVGFDTLAASGNNTPSQAISNVLDSICFANNGSPTSPQLVDICNDFLSATPGELEKMLNELAPKEVSAQNQLSSIVVTQQLDNIRKRLASLRRGDQGVVSNQLSIQLKGQAPVMLADLFQGQGEQTGGGASGDNLSNLKRMGFFVSGRLGQGSHDETSLEDGYEFDTQGVTLGADYRYNNKLYTGAAFGLSSNQMNVNNNGGDLDITGFSLLAYGSYYFSQSTYFESVFGLYQNDFTATRNINYSVAGNSRSYKASSETENRMASISMGAGYEMASASGETYTFSVNLDYIKSGYDGYSESGAGGANLIIEKRNETQLTSTVDFQFTHPISRQTLVLIPQLGFAWKHEFKDDATIVEGSFKDDPSGTRYRFSTEKPDPNYFKLNLGLTFIIPGGTTGFMNYEKTLGKDGFTEDFVSMGMRLEF